MKASGKGAAANHREGPSVPLGRRVANTAGPHRGIEGDRDSVSRYDSLEDAGEPRRERMR